MKNGATSLLKGAIILVGIPVLIIGIMGLNFLLHNQVNFLIYPIVIGIYATYIPFYIGLYQAFRLLCYVDDNNAFSEASVIALGNIKKCTIPISIIYAAIFPIIFHLADFDPPGFKLFGLIPVFASTVIGIFASVLQRLVQEVINKN